MENGLQIASKEFDGKEKIEKIHLLEFIDSDEKLLIIGEDQEGLKFIVWDLYDAGKCESTKLNDFPITIVENLDARLARTSGNILQINDDGKVSSVLKRVENDLKKTKKEKNKKLHHKASIKSKKDKSKKQNGKLDESHTIHYDENKNEDFKPIVNDKELWVLGDYERNSIKTKKDRRQKHYNLLLAGLQFKFGIKSRMITKIKMNFLTKESHFLSIYGLIVFQ